MTFAELYAQHIHDTCTGLNITYATCEPLVAELLGGNDFSLYLYDSKQDLVGWLSLRLLTENITVGGDACFGPGQLKEAKKYITRQLKLRAKGATQDASLIADMPGAALANPTGDRNN
jgi:hypothetical protein